MVLDAAARILTQQHFQFFLSCIQEGYDYCEVQEEILSILPELHRQRKGFGARAVVSFQFFLSCILATIPFGGRDTLAFQFFLSCIPAFAFGAIKEEISTFNSS